MITSDKKTAHDAAKDISRVERTKVFVYKTGARDDPEYEVVRFADRQEYHKQSYPMFTFDCGWAITH